MTEIKYGPWKIGKWTDSNPDTRGYVYLDLDTYAYREVIEPKRETMVLYAKGYGTTLLVTTDGKRFPSANLRLHVPLVDGEIEDGAMIRVERL